MEFGPGLTISSTRERRPRVIGITLFIVHRILSKCLALALCPALIGSIGLVQPLSSTRGITDAQD